MTRRFLQHDLRQVRNLCGIWDFAFLGDVDPDSVNLDSIEYNDHMAVPGSFDATPAYAGKRGLAAYRRFVVLPDTAPYRLVFGGVHHWCRVYANEKQITEHVGGFTRFAADIKGPGEVEIIVLVDNRFDYQRCPLHLEYMDWYHYGGITRPVELHRLGSLWIDALRLTTADYQTRQIDIVIDYGAAAAPGKTELVITWGRDVLLSESVDLQEAQGRIKRTVKLEGAALWSPDAPNLHNVRVRLGEDDLRERIGIRQVRAEGQQILINDAPVRLLGFNRHESHPQFGAAVPDAMMVSDIQQLKDMGCNFVRGSHYPQDEHFLDLCDENGILVWDEATGWQQTAEHLTDEHYLKAAIGNINAMMAVAYNHPSVILWGILNESHSHDKTCRPAYERLLGHIREQDSSRLLTYASNHPFDDVCLDLVDVVSINAYPGWYHEDIAYIPTHLDNIVAHLDESGQGDKPLIISEIGAGAIPGWRDWNETRWSEQYQAALLDKVIETMFVQRKRYAGLAIWQFCDIRTSEQVGRVLGRPRGFNNKGVVDEYRRSKLAYDVVKARFRALRGL